MTFLTTITIPSIEEDKKQRLPYVIIDCRSDLTFLTKYMYLILINIVDVYSDYRLRQSHILKGLGTIYLIRGEKEASMFWWLIKHIEIIEQTCSIIILG